MAKSKLGSRADAKMFKERDKQQKEYNKSQGIKNHGQRTGGGAKKANAVEKAKAATAPKVKATATKSAKSSGGARKRDKTVDSHE